MRKIFALLALSLCLFACAKRNDIVPYVPVNEIVQIDNPHYTLSGIGGYAMIDGGVAGIIVYHRADDRYVAYDRCSSYQPEKKCAVVIDEDVYFQVVDTCSGSKFSLEDGSPVHAPASQSLRKYTVIQRNIYELEIRN